MIRRNQVFLNRVNILPDMLFVILSYILASWIYFDFLDGYENNLAVVSGKTVSLAVAYAVAYRSPIFAILKKEESHDEAKKLNIPQDMFCGGIADRFPAGDLCQGGNKP